MQQDGTLLAHLVFFIMLATQPVECGLDRTFLDWCFIMENLACSNLMKPGITSLDIWKFLHVENPLNV
jgi:hypothetical protein